VTVSEPATTWAFDITRPGEITNPLPSSTFWQPGAKPRIFTTLGLTRSTTGSVISPTSGASTSAIGVRPNGCHTFGRPDVFSSALSRPGTVRNCSGTTWSTSLHTLEPLTAATNLG
jgi:hypothetical protein